MYFVSTYEKRRKKTVEIVLRWEEKDERGESNYDTLVFKFLLGYICCTEGIHCDISK
jgi:hypothetical protein